MMKRYDLIVVGAGPGEVPHISHTPGRDVPHPQSQRSAY